MNYELKVTITNNKAGKFHYQVIDENGTIISERKSNREYVACTSKGTFYFGRLDLIGKGDHGRYMRDCIERMKRTIEQFEKISKYYICGYDEYVSNAKSRLESYQQIAYKK
jgi:hypothetical protein